ncbi:DUF1404 domain-containing protein [Metallosphaera tengchongensis]|uniref:DUF1404 domain-containing protein n=1 Tax=Metallosphaera tengchongensis TaxID=1532350 RepID=A0A6N0NSM3_9CREN|nr:DUF1404 domain-containing protein [Metallosphaera tengchongensis]QKQ99184.1 DUF1404 domain-containing protein [Metallosphaera tengchongensis]
MRFTYFRSRNSVIALILLIFSINPYTELKEFSLEPLFMATHYLLFISGFLLMERRTLPGYLVSLSIALVGLWHVPLLYALAASSPAYRAMNDLSLFSAGILGGGATSRLSTAVKLFLFILWMSADSVLSVILIVGWPPYSDEVYPFSPFSINQELSTGLVMFGIMTVIFIIVILKFLRSIFKI